MMLDSRPHPRFRTRTRELRPFWQAMATRRHPTEDLELRVPEWAGIPSPIVNRLAAAGITCNRQVESCPDWLLKTVPELGPDQIGLLRLFFPYRRDVHRVPTCGAQQLQNQRWLDANTVPLTAEAPNSP